MYVARFDQRLPRLPRPRRAILLEAESALARCLDEEDYDLSGELLLSWPLTAASWSAGATFGFRVLARVEDTAGFLPTASTRIERRLQRHRRGLRFRDQYDVVRRLLAEAAREARSKVIGTAL
jgi:Domain of unknown function (DUF6895)